MEKTVDKVFEDLICLLGHQLSWLLLIYLEI
jgi:hypothetical protein